MGLTAIVLGAAAGGGFPQWNCNCDVCRLAWAGDPRVRARTQASLAVSADRQHWTLLNASPDLRAQIQATQRCIRKSLRDSPIEAVVLTGAEIDQTAGLLSLRERSPFTLMATAATLAAVADNPMFGVLAPDVVSRRAITPGEKFALGDGLQAELFMVPGKLPLYLEGENPRNRGGKRRQCRRRNFGRQQAPRLCSRRCRDDAFAARSGCRAPTSSCSTARCSPMTR